MVQFSTSVVLSGIVLLFGLCSIGASQVIFPGGVRYKDYSAFENYSKDLEEKSYSNDEPDFNNQQTVWLLPDENSTPTVRDRKYGPRIDPWSVVWYIGAFGGLVIFFLVVSCSEWCCRQGTMDPANSMHRCQRSAAADCERQIPPETPPPAYHLFAPPPYDTVFVDEKPKLNIYVVPIHGLNKQCSTGTPDSPPNTTSIST